jgi:hypothetical protein
VEEYTPGTKEQEAHEEAQTGIKGEKLVPVLVEKQNIRPGNNIFYFWNR